MNLVKNGLKISSAIFCITILATPSTKAFSLSSFMKSDSKVTAQDKLKINENNIDNNKAEYDAQKEEVYSIIASISERLSVLKELEKSQDDALVELEKAHKAWAAESYCVDSATYGQYTKANENSKEVSNKISDIKVEINGLIGRLSKESSNRFKSLEKYKSSVKTAATKYCDYSKSVISKSI